MESFERQDEELAAEVERLRAEVRELRQAATERRESRELLKVSEARLAEAQRIARLGHWEWNISRNEVYWSSELYEMFGVAPDAFEATRQGFLDRVHPDDRAAVEEHIKAAVVEGRPYVVEFRIVSNDGSLRYLHGEGQLERADNGEPHRLVGTCQDVTERKQAELERRQLESQIQHARKLESLAVLAAGVANDFNNVLLAIGGNADLALMDLPENEPVCEMIREVQRAADRGAKLTNELMAYSGITRLNSAPIDINYLVDRSSQLWGSILSSPAELRFRLGDRLPDFHGDGDQIVQVLTNLVENAREAVDGGGGAITVSTGVLHVDRAYLSKAYLAEELSEGSYVYMRVSDTGRGIDDEAKARIFDPFYTTKVAGRGLGLAAVSGIVRSHRGAIFVESEPGRGSIFTVLFPTEPQSFAAKASTSWENQEWRGTGTVLVVDDEPAVRSVVKLMVERRGFRVVTACDGREGIEAFAEHRDDLRAVLLDLNMPRMGGDEAFVEMRDLDASIPIIVMTGSADTETAKRLAGRGLAGILPKPFHATVLIRRLQDALEVREIECWK